MWHHFQKTKQCSRWSANPILVCCRSWEWDESEIKAAAIFSLTFSINARFLLWFDNLPPLRNCCCVLIVWLQGHSKSHFWDWFFCQLSGKYHWSVSKVFSLSVWCGNWFRFQNKNYAASEKHACQTVLTVKMLPTKRHRGQIWERKKVSPYCQNIIADL